MTTWHDLSMLVKPLPEDATPPPGPTGCFRDVISLQAIFVTMTIALLAYVQKDPMFHVRVDGLFAILVSIPLLGLFHVVRGRVPMPDGNECFLYAKAVRSYARQALFFDLAILAAVLSLHWQGQLPGQ
jgi:hypothetical protein